MQRIIPCTLTVLLLLIIPITCCCQNVFWLSGSWQGRAYFPASDGLQNYDVILKVFNVKGNKFEGVIKIIEPSDTSVHFDSRISGTIYDKYLIIKRDKILYLKNAPGIKWKVSCNNCRPPRMTFSIEDGKFFFRGEEKDCYKECNGITEFSKDITEFDSSAKASAYALINGVQNSNANARASTESNPSINGTNASPLPEDNSMTPRTALLSADTIISTEHNNTLLLSQKATGSLPKNPSIIIKESEPKRIAVLSAGTIVLSINKPSFLLPQKQSYSLLRKMPSIKIKGTEQVRIPVLVAGNIVLTKSKPSLLIYKKVSHTLQHGTLSEIVKQSPQRLAQNKLASSHDTVSLISSDTSFLAKSTVPAHHDPISVLPVGYAERKKNVIRTLQVNTDSIVLRVYDNGVVDGDVVSVIYNEQIVIDKLSLTAHAVTIKIPVNKFEINTLVFHAHNLGEFPPNTAKLEIVDGNKKEELTVASDLTVSSTIDIVHKH